MAMQLREISVGDLLKMHRERSKIRLTQKELAELVEVSSRALRDWEGQDPLLIARAQFSVGFCYMWRQEYQKAEAEFMGSLALAEEVQDAALKCRNLTYLGVIYRKQKRLKKAREYALATLAWAEETHSIEYSGVGKANLAWLALEEGSLEEARSYALEVLEIWDKPASGPFLVRSLALWPLLEIAMSKEEIGPGIEIAKKLLDPSQHRYPPSLEEVLKAATMAGEEGNLEGAREKLGAAVKLAQETGYF